MPKVTTTAKPAAPLAGLWGDGIDATPVGMMSRALDPRTYSSLVKTQTAAAERMVRLNDEMLRFAIQRLEADRRYLGELALPEDPVSALTAWTGYLASTASDIAEEGTRIWSLGMTEFADALIGMQSLRHDDPLARQKAETADS